MDQTRILWVDDEIDMLNMHILFLREKGFYVATANSGQDAVDLFNSEAYDLVFLDENMPGLSGLETLDRLKSLRPEVPVVMVTKSDEEDIMEAAIGSKISDYLIKPVNPKQILLSIKKNTEQKKLISQKTTNTYQSEFASLGMQINEARSWQDWMSVYKKIVFWELELEKHSDNTFDDILKMQKSEANSAFAKYVKKSYETWFQSDISDKPLLSPGIMREKVFPLLKDQRKVLFILIDNLRYDQWKSIQPGMNEYLRCDSDDLYYSILPTATQYSRNALFAGLMPSEIDKIVPDLWLNDDEEGGKNLYEEELLLRQLTRYGIRAKAYYEKISSLKNSRKLVDHLPNVMKNDFVVLVFNFIDMLSHARTEVETIKQLAEDEAAYRSLTISWFQHSPLLQVIKYVAEMDESVQVVLTTDHGSIRVDNPVKVIGDRNTSSNLRYKQGRSLNYNPKEVFAISNPASVYLPSPNVSSSYIFASGSDFFAYPNNYNHYAAFYRNTFQHGGVSLEEMLIPLVVMSKR